MTQASALAIRTCGNGPDLALIHGWGLAGRIWDPVVEPLATRFRVHVIDLPGYGDNRDAALPGNESGDNIGAIADAIVAALPERVSLCGWSLGAHIAVAALARHQQRIARLVLCAATPCFIEKDDWPHGVGPQLVGSFETLLRMSPRNVLSRFATMINQGDQAARQITRHATAVVESAGAPLPTQEALQGGLRLLTDFDWRPLAPKIRHPVLLVHGDLDPLMPLPGAQALQASFPAARLDVFQGSAHTPFLSQPERFVAALAEFMESVEFAPVAA